MGRTRDKRIVDCGYFEMGADGDDDEEEVEAALEEYFQTVEGLEPGAPVSQFCYACL